ncbi:MAG: hypothetical protein LBN97_08230 [Oscillospiraceae bacterium]|jgi:hypothetical protein|nr:hypothetical protein [Oscillospiraceae bacterium]
MRKIFALLTALVILCAACSSGTAEPVPAAGQSDAGENAPHLYFFNAEILEIVSDDRGPTGKLLVSVINSFNEAVEPEETLLLSFSYDRNAALNYILDTARVGEPALISYFNNTIPNRGGEVSTLDCGGIEVPYTEGFLALPSPEA